MRPAAGLDVLHVAQPTDAGVARCVAQLATYQRAEGLRVAVACPAGGDLRADLTVSGVPVLPWEAVRSPVRGVPGEVRRLRSLIARADPALVHLHSAKAGLDGRLALRGSRPTVFQPHAWSFEAVAGPVQRGSLAWERWARRWTTLLVCVSRAELESGAAARCVPERSVIVMNGVDTVGLDTGPGAREQARALLGLGPGPLVVCVGRLARQKGQDVLLTAWADVLAGAPDAHLVLVGDGPDAPALRARQVPSVTFAGASSDVRSWYAAADVVAVPSRWEGMALTPLEAMAARRSVVVSDVTGSQESVPTGAGALVPSEDPRALASALVRRLTGEVDVRAEGQVGRAHVVAHHDTTRAAAAITRACAELTR